MATYAGQPDLELAVGGASVLKQLLDKDGDGAADAPLVTACLQRADAEADLAIQVVLSLPLASTPDALRYHCAALGAYYAWTMGAEGQAMPEAILRQKDDAIQFFDQVAKRERTLGVKTKPASDLQVTQVERSTTQKPRVTFETTKGFAW